MKNYIEVKDCVGKRVLWTKYGAEREGIVEEVSPSEKYVKVDGEWYRADLVYIIEVLHQRIPQ